MGGIFASVNFRLFLYSLPIPILLFYVLAIVGCVSTSPGIPNIFLLQFKKGADELRLSYFGMCHKSPSSLDCAPSSKANVDQLLHAFAISGTNAISPFLNSALTLQNKVFIPFLVGAGCDFFLTIVLVVLFKRHEKKSAWEDKDKRTWENLKLATMVTAWSSTAFAFAAAWATSQALASVTHTADIFAKSGGLDITAGSAIQRFQRTIAALALIFSWRMHVITHPSASDGK
ncbi:hypothetical protein BU16DRAFT_139258 [Lophium mytilinum]|uniref:Uncharacterized protein n=1 Tax=Lophium mytilinum TaxID=390894 RepID=A0A6A6QEX3_9PEZI|nr:hypothetical protein BU16DRAFT_139258 [Lophium mytilinum]